MKETNGLSVEPIVEGFIFDKDVVKYRTNVTKEIYIIGEEPSQQEEQFFKYKEYQYTYNEIVELLVKNSNLIIQTKRE